MSISAVIVHFHAPSLAAAAVRSLRDDARRSGVVPEVIIVDNGSTEVERAELARLAATVVGPGANRGYAAGLNRGVEASSGDLLLLANADVEVLPGSLDALEQTLDAGYAVVGPRFYLDPGRAWLQPPADRRSYGFELATILARAGVGTATVRRAWRRRAHRFWSTAKPLPMRQLSGALLAVRRDTWQALGGFDEGYRLYFEETDWLMRLAATGRRAALAPAAHAVHSWGQSTRLEPRAAAWFEDSARRFRRLWYGALGTRLLEGLSRRLDGRSPRQRHPSRRPATGRMAPAWLEIAYDAAGFPAAGHPLASRTGTEPEPPPELAAPGYVLRCTTDGGHDLWAGQRVGSSKG